MAKWIVVLILCLSFSGCEWILSNDLGNTIQLKEQNKKLDRIIELLEIANDR